MPFAIANSFRREGVTCHLPGFIIVFHNLVRTSLGDGV